MKIDKITTMSYGISIQEFDAKNTTDIDIIKLKEAIYGNLIVVLKNQFLSPYEYVKFGKKFGQIEKYYEEMYHHPEEKDIFVSSNIKEDDHIQGVPRTGSFWHSDYAFMTTPFSISIIYPQVVPKLNRGTYFIDMAEAYEQLSEDLRTKIKETFCEHSVRKYFKIRPWDAYRPMGDILQEIEQRTPPVKRPTVVTHPISKRKILYVSQGFTVSIWNDKANQLDSSLLQVLFEQSGQTDKSFSHPLINLLQIEMGDIVLWDNRRLIHHAKHFDIKEPAKSFRLTVYDEFPFSLEETKELESKETENCEV